MKRGAVVGIVAGAAAVAIGAGVTAWIVSRPPSAEAVAESYLRALSEGDFDTIAPLLPDSVDAEHLESAFAGATGYISDYAYTLTGDGGGMLGVRADVEIDGEPGVVGFLLTPEGGRWKIADFLAVLDVTTSIDERVIVNDAALVGGTLTAASTTLLPAVYPVSPVPTGILSGGTEVAVTNEQAVGVTVEAALAPGATTLAQEQLDLYASACAQPASVVPANCGIRVPWAADLATLDGVRFRIEQLPRVSLSPDGRTFAATDGVIVATATGTARDGSTASFTYRADDWALRGSLRFSGDQMTLRIG
ncbi:hypothetical protein QL996_01560 [Planococcus sp. APC 4015]|nr:hypothetical protein [Planococcus sp. APC 4015]